MNGSNRPSVSVVVPVYNSRDSLPLLIERLEPVLAAHFSSFEAVLVNDGSRDDSWSVIDGLAQVRPWVRGINLMRNYGQHNALLCGIREARNELILTIDDDLQHPPEEVPKLLEGLRDTVDVVYGTPEAEPHGLWRGLASRFTKAALQAAMGAEVARKVSALRLFRTRARDAFADYRSPYVSIDVLLTWATTRFAAVVVRHEPRKLGTSNYTFRKLVTHALNMMTGFSTLPLRISSLIGFGFTLFGLGILALVIARYFIEGGSVPGFPFLASIVSLFSGAQLLALGIIGEYLARMHFRMMERPTYTVRDTSAPPSAAAGGSSSSASPASAPPSPPHAPAGEPRQ